MKLLHGIIIGLIIINIYVWKWKYPLEGFSTDMVTIRGFRIKAMFGKNSVYGSFQYPIGTFEGYIHKFWKLPSIPQEEIRAETIDGDYYFYFRTLYTMQKGDISPIEAGIRETIQEGIQMDGLPPLTDICLLDEDSKCLELGTKKPWWKFWA
jgi:hypothetical protein